MCYHECFLFQCSTIVDYSYHILCLFLLKVIREEWEKYLLSKVELQTLPKFNKKKKPKASKGFGILDGVIPSVSGQKADVSSISKLENDALLAAAHEISKLAKGNSDAGDGGTNKEHGKESERSEGKKKKPVFSKPDPESESSIQSKTPALKHDGTHNEQCMSIAGRVLKNASDMDGRILRKHDQEPGNAQLSSVFFHALENDKNILDILQPSVIILYHPDIAFVREIEVYKSENPSKRLKIYFLFYENSTEVQKFEASIRRENGAFESLIRQKALMMLPVNQV